MDKYKFYHNTLLTSQCITFTIQATKLSIQNTKLEQKLKDAHDNSEDLLRDLRKEFECKRRKEREIHKAAMDESKAKISFLSEELNKVQPNKDNSQDFELLQKTIYDLRLELKITKDEMNFFRKELVNREENYNSRFSGNENCGSVGVMTVIKQKKNGESTDYSKKNKGYSMKNGQINTQKQRRRCTLPRI